MSETLVIDGPIVESRSHRSRAMIDVMAPPMRFTKDAFQGACAGLLTLAGSTQFSMSSLSPQSLASIGLPPLETIAMQLVAGNFTALLQIVGAAALFLAAGRGFARVLGLLVFVAGATAYFNGVEAVDLVERTREIYQALGPAIETFQQELSS